MTTQAQIVASRAASQAQIEALQWQIEAMLAQIDASRAATQAQIEASHAASQVQINASRAASQVQIEALQWQIEELLSQIAASRAAMQVQVNALSAQVSVAVTAVGAALERMDAQGAERYALQAARLDAIESTVTAGHAAMGEPYLERMQLAKRALLSPAEEMLAISDLSQRTLMSFLDEEDVLGLRAASRACRDAVAEHAWGDYFTDRSVIKGSLASWRRCFPRATAASLAGNKTVQDADLVHLRGANKVNMMGCAQITDAGLAHLRGIHVLGMDGCSQITDAGLAHLRGIHTLGMDGCTAITDAGLAHLHGIHSLYMDDCAAITDAGLAHLTGIHTLYMWRCPGITNAGMLHLRGIRVLHIKGPQITDAALAQLEGADIQRS